MAPQHRASKVSAPAGRQLHCMRESTETAHPVRSSPPERERWNSGKSEPSKSSAPRSIEPGSGESPEWNRSAVSSASAPEGFGASAGLIYIRGAPTPRAGLRWHRETARENPALRHQVGTPAVIGPFQARIGSLRGRRTQPDSPRNLREALRNASSLRASPTAE